MKTLKLLFAIFPILFFGLACQKLTGAVDAANDIPGKMDDLNKQMGETNDSVRKTHVQALKETLEMMLDEKNASQLAPVPTGVMPGAQKFAEEVTSQELLEWIKVSIASIDKTDLIPHFDSTGKEVDPTIEEQNKEFLRKFQLYQCLRAVAAFVPQTVDLTKPEYLRRATAERIANEELSGRYRREALAFLMLRLDFTRDVLVQDAYISRGLQFVAEAAEAVRLMRQVDWIISLPIASSIAMKTMGLSGLGTYDRNVDLKLDSKTIQKNVAPWDDIAKALASMPLDLRSDSSDPALNEREKEQETSLRDSLLQEARDRAAYWKVKVP